MFVEVNILDGGVNVIKVISDHINFSLSLSLSHSFKWLYWHDCIKHNVAEASIDIISTQNKHKERKQ